MMSINKTQNTQSYTLQTQNNMAELELYLIDVLPDVVVRYKLLRELALCYSGYYARNPSATRPLLVFQGTGSNGKSTFLRLIKLVFGSSYQQLDEKLNTRYVKVGVRLTGSEETDLSLDVVQTQLATFKYPLIITHISDVLPDVLPPHTMIVKFSQFFVPNPNPDYLNQLPRDVHIQDRLPRWRTSLVLKLTQCLPNAN